MDWIVQNVAMIVGVLFGLSEALALIPGVESNSVFQLIVNVLKWLKDAVANKQVPPAQ